MLRFDPSTIQTPCYVCDQAALERNLERLSFVQHRTGCKILLALKSFAMFSLFGQIRQHLHGVTASSLDEARLGFEEFGREVHVCAPAYRSEEIDGLTKYGSHVVFNSFSQWDRFKQTVDTADSIVSCGIRINPEHSEVSVPIYDPCAPFSRLGVTAEQFSSESLEGIAGLHFHTLCELNADSLKRTLSVFEKKFGAYLSGMQWINFGGGHHITRDDYDVDLLCRLLSDFTDRYGVQVYLEPGEAVVLNTGFLVSSVLDIVHNEMDIAILDTSAAAHMPDVLEMPYRPDIVGAEKAGRMPYTYRLGGLTCLAGDVIGDYSFSEPLNIGTKLVFTDMAHYTMVKNNTFNGIRLPDIAIVDETGTLHVMRRFQYEDYRNRLS